MSDQSPRMSDQPPGMSDQPPGMSDQPPGMSDHPPGTSDQPPGTSDQPPPRQGLHVRAVQVLRAKPIWIAPIVLGCLFTAAMVVLYLGSIVNPTGHLRGLPVRIVNEDPGAVVDGQHVDVGASLAGALEGSSAVITRLKLTPSTLRQAHAEMDKAAAYATLVIPPTLTRSVLLGAGVSTPGATPPTTAAVDLQENLRLGSIGVSLASGVLTPAVAKISPLIGARLSALASPEAKSNPILASRIANPITLTTSVYRPLPDHTALGLSAFYIALLALMAGFIGATLVNTSVDAGLGYASSQMGTRFTQRRPVAINRTQTLLVKLAIAVVAAPVLIVILLLVAVPLLGMNAPHIVRLWGLLTLAALMIAMGTLTLFAIFGAIGQLLAVLLLVYLSLASSGGTVPIQALPAVFRTVGHVEPLRNTLLGTRAILYFGARGDAGLTTSLIILVCEIFFWVALGLAATAWYDHKGLDRISPELIGYIDAAVDRAIAEHSEQAS